VMTAAFDPAHPIQRVGHGQYVETPDGTPYHTFLMGRPLAQARACQMGRETGIERCFWGDDGWLYLEKGGLLPRENVPHISSIEQQNSGSNTTTYTFDDGVLPLDFQWLRTPQPDRLFRVEKGALVLVARESLGSWFEQSLLARRQEHSIYRAETTIDFSPSTYQQAAGLTTYYNRFKFYAAMITIDNTGDRIALITSSIDNYPSGGISSHAVVVLDSDGPVDFAVEVNGSAQQFFIRQRGLEWQTLGPELDASFISDEAPPGEHQSFTGAFVGVAAFDQTGQAKEARITRFSYCG